MHSVIDPLTEVRDALAARDWRSGFDVSSLMRGKAYHHRERATLTLVQAGDTRWMLEGLVQGSRSKPYRTTVEVPFPGQGERLLTRCSCPLGSACKHAVALLEAVGGGRAQIATSRAAGPGLSATDDDHIPPLLARWIEATVAPASSPPAQTGSGTVDHVLYSFHGPSGWTTRRGAIVRLCLLTCRPANSDRPVLQRTDLSSAGRGSFPSYFSAEDRRLTQEALTLPGRVQLSGSYPEFIPEGRFWGVTAREILATGRAIFGEKSDAVLREGPERRIVPGWIELESGDQATVIRFADTESPAIWVPVDPPIQIDPQTLTWGPARWEAPVPPATWLAAPEVSSGHLNEVSERMVRAGWDAPLRPKPVKVRQLKGKDSRPVPRLVLRRHSFRLPSWGPYGGHRFTRSDLPDFSDLPVAELQFRYGPLLVENPSSDPSTTLVKTTGESIVRGKRDILLESQLRGELESLGFFQAFLHPILSIAENRGCGDLYLPGDMESGAADFRAAWYEFLSVLPAIQKKGWEVETDSSFGFTLTEPDAWWTGLEGGGTVDWFRFDYGIEIGGRRVSIMAALRSYTEHANLAEDLEILRDAPEGAVVPFELAEENLVISFPARKLADLLQCLLELFEAPDSDGFSVHRLGAARIATLFPELAGETAKTLREMGKRLADFRGIPKVKPPRSLQAQLRPYQTEGLSWLQFLRTHGLGGILADDMGLGKTVQTLAHVLTERAAKRLDQPCLIVAPTSVVSNWAAETERFAPSLRVLVLQGPDRKKRFEEIPAHDLVLTSYPLLGRDAEALQAHEYHSVILDEAQCIKNPVSKMAQAACGLRSRHRLCLTGTPMENHLGELWSLFHFLMPGFLGEQDTFRRNWRRPIENDGDESRRSRLAGRVAPLMLRRTRGEVLEELPPRMDIVRTVPLERDQAELYEVVRAAMDKKVRDAIASNGLARSQIIVLDALLKLRQICCHPRLLKTTSARKTTQSAKLNLFRELITGLVEEKRRVLVFSQFTSMLEIIEECLAAENIAWQKLTGDTPASERGQLVKAFQGGNTPVFLISLKAGGSGLNLTAADTVIHYDPWWNPAVEEQATGRAHRMGQANPVFVYRLVTEGTIEERILELQQRKAEIANAILDGSTRKDGKGLAIEREDLERLLAPI